MNVRNLLSLAVLLLVQQSFAIGLLIPKPDNIPPLGVKDHNVSITIKNNLAHTHVTEVFYNHTHRPLEAVFVFPIPRGASIDEFAMMMNGKRVTGEVLEKDKARKIYTDIVRRMRDPGLIEHMGNNLFKASIFPVPARGEQKIEISFSQMLKPEAGLAEYVYPLKTSQNAFNVSGSLSFYCHLQSDVPIKSIYSPTHKVHVVRKSDREVKISFEQRGAALDRDFQLFYGVSPKDVGLNMLTHKIDGKDGYFTMMVAPKVETDKKTAPKDVCFVVDTSGSMAGNKMDQTRKALTYCISQLNNKDRFNIVRFSTDVDLYRSELIAVNDAAKKEATAYIKELEARGGTDIHSALSKAVAMKKDDARPYLIVFLTDGHPTIGYTDKNQIIDDLKKKNAAGTRIFVFGVGSELNTLLLDQLADETRATTQYVRTSEDIEVKVSNFFDKVESPVLTDVELTFADGSVYDLYPRKPGDLFRGQQLVLFGRYRKPGHQAIEITGTLDGKRQRFVYETKLAENETDNTFIAGLWAQRKVGFLLAQIRQNGEKPELKNEVIRLGKEFGIVTPYTSYLVVEDNPQPIGGIRRPPPPPRPVPMPMRERRMEEAAERLDVSDDASMTEAAGADAFAPQAMKQVEGKAAVKASEVISKMKKSDVQRSNARAPKHVDSRTFIWHKGLWIEEDWLDNQVDPVRIKYLSDAWFKLIDIDPELGKILSLGQHVVFRLKTGKAILVTDDGKDTLSKQDIRELFKK